MSAGCVVKGSYAVATAEERGTAGRVPVADHERASVFLVQSALANNRIRQLLVSLLARLSEGVNGLSFRTDE